MSDIKEARKQIDQIDSEILLLLEKRFGLLPEVIKFKEEHGLKIYQPEREQEILIEKKKLAVKLGLSEKFAESLFLLIFAESRNIQQKILS